MASSSRLGNLTKNGQYSDELVFFTGKKMHYHLVGLNCRYSHSCLALFYIRNALEAHLPDSRVTISQLTINDPYYDTLLRISRHDDAVLFFSVYIWNDSYISRLVRDLDRLQPERPIILGGPQAPNLEGLPGCCSVVNGEIEGVGDSFYSDLAHGRMRPVYQAESGQPFPSPYRRGDFTGGLKNRQVYYESSRGCPFSCSYCLSSVRHGVVYKALETVKNELAEIIAYRPKIIKFVDRTFNDDPHRALEIWRFLADHAGKTRFHFEIAPDRFTEGMLSFLKAVPPDLFQFEIGVQSTNPETLTSVHRRMDIDLSLSNIRRLVRLDSIHLHVDLILGLPYETENSFRRSFNQVFELGPHYIQMGLLKVLPETAIRREAERFGLMYCRRPPYEALATRWLDHQSLAVLYAFGKCVEVFYNNRYFRSLWRYLLNRREEPFQFFQALLRCCERHQFFDQAPTQQLMTSILHELASERDDQELFLELLRYDWLCCGHRFLPQCLETTPLSAIRAQLRKRLPQNLSGLFTYRNRNEFFKRGIFLHCSGAALKEIGMGTDGRAGTLCFFPEQAAGVIKHCRVVLMDKREDK